jgi:glycosyltransferase involved in cell wall biosynthesis
MRVGVNARLLHAPTLRGWNRYTVNLVAGLGALGVDLVLYTARPLSDVHGERLPRERCTVRASGPMRYPMWEQVWLPRACVTDRVDVLHCPVNFGLPWRRPCPTVLTLHDAIDATLPAARRLAAPGSWLTAAYHWVARTRASAIITPSGHSRDDLVRRLGIRPERITVVPEAADPRFGAPPPGEVRHRVRQRHGLTKPYVFYVGGWEERKNIPFLIEAFAQAQLGDTELVLAGGGDDRATALRDVAADLGVAERVRLVGEVPDQELPTLYAEARCFVYPSRHEGFGLQLCEAMALGCPTLAARATSLPEVLGHGGDTFDPEEPAELISLLERVIRDEAYRAELADRATDRSRAFSWERTARATVAVYQRLLHAT